MYTSISSKAHIPAHTTKSHHVQRVPVARDYPNAAKEQARSYSDYDHLRITWGDPSHYEIGEIIGHGTYAKICHSQPSGPPSKPSPAVMPHNVLYADAYIGHVKGKRSQRVVIKHLKHASWYKIKREIAVMQVKGAAAAAAATTAASGHGFKMPFVTRSFF
eukprot:scaffold93946_cov23-Tisochrysis_lutea.AAC.1